MVPRGGLSTTIDNLKTINYLRHTLFLVVYHRNVPKSTTCEYCPGDSELDEIESHTDEHSKGNTRPATLPSSCMRPPGSQ